MASNEPLDHIPRKIGDPHVRDDDPTGERGVFPGAGLTSDDRDPDAEQHYCELNLGFLRYPLLPAPTNPNIINEVLDQYGVDVKKNTALRMMLSDLWTENEKLKGDNHHLEAQLAGHTREILKITNNLRTELWSKGALEDERNRAMATCESLWCQLREFREQETQRRMILSDNVLRLQSEIESITASNAHLRVEVETKDSLLIDADRTYVKLIAERDHESRLREQETQHVLRLKSELESIKASNANLRVEVETKDSLLIDADRTHVKLIAERDHARAVPKQLFEMFQQRNDDFLRAAETLITTVSPSSNSVDNISLSTGAIANNVTDREAIGELTITKEEMKPQDLTICREVHAGMTSKRNNINCLFLEPVDRAFYRDYLRVVKRPMDLR
jgi:hypothetical protein